MDNSRAYSFRSLIIIIMFMTLLIILVNTGLYLGLKQLLMGMIPDNNIKLIIPISNVEIVIQSLSDVVKSLSSLSDNFFVWVVPAVAAFFALSAVILWFVMKIFLSSIFSKVPTVSSSDNLKPSKPSAKTDEEKVKKDYAEQRMEQERYRRLFLHFLSVLQREGRLLDFLNEDLNIYEDEEIGAAVRSIQEDCKKTVEKYLAPVPVLNKEEGDLISIDAGFDPDAIKLTGNVSGEPPFKGILRHKGWKAAKKDIPRLSDVLDSSIIAPAEVEIE